MLAGAQYSHEGLEATKEIVYDRIVEYLQIGGHPTEWDPAFEESSVNNLIYSVIGPIIRNFIRTTGRRSIQLQTEKEIVSEDGETGGREEFAIMDLISEDEEVFIFIIEAKRTSVGKGMRQCFLALKDARDDHNKGEGIVYGFITTGEDWRMIKYDGTFQMTEKFKMLFDTLHIVHTPCICAHICYSQIGRWKRLLL